MSTPAIRPHDRWCGTEFCINTRLGPRTGGEEGAVLLSGTADKNDFEFNLSFERQLAGAKKKDTARTDITRDQSNREVFGSAIYAAATRVRGLSSQTAAPTASAPTSANTAAMRIERRDIGALTIKLGPHGVAIHPRFGGAAGEGVGVNALRRHS